MKVACGVTGPASDYRINANFGKSHAFVIIDTETGQRCILENPFREAREASGTGAAKLLVRQDVDAVICGLFGSGAARTFCAASIGMYRIKAGTPLRSVPVSVPSAKTRASHVTYARKVVEHLKPA
jgi:predicted Fe-Mo cluster-binding NifX family protein